MIRLEDQRITIVLDKNYNSPEDVHAFISALLWYASHIKEDCICEEDNFYICELIRMMIPEPDQINYNSV